MYKLKFIFRKRELSCALPYLGKTSLDLRTRLRRTFEKKLPHCKLKVILDLSVGLRPYFISKIYLRKKSAPE